MSASETLRCRNTDSLSNKDVEASGGKQVIDRKVGDSVELSSNLPTEGVSSASWKYGNSVVAYHDSGVTANNPFRGRVEFNDVSFSLTVRELTLQDSGDFSFLSEANGQQRPTVIITLQVHEPISTKPKLVYNISEPDLTGSCTVYLECRAAPHRNISYILTVGNQPHEGPKLHYHITPQDGDTTVTCNASNAVSEMSASETLRCRNTDSLSNKDVEASGGKQVIDRKVGDSVELSSNLPTEGVSSARWRHGNSVVAVQGSGVTANNPFLDRVEFNDVSFSLTVRELTLQDSGDFSFLSEANGQQRSTVIITLQVHEPISTKPKLVYNISEPDLNGSCTVYLECRAAPHRNTNYILTVGNQTHEGPKLHYHITPQDGDTTVTCNASNAVSEMSASETLRCRNTDSLSNKGSNILQQSTRMRVSSIPTPHLLLMMLQSMNP
ncbi:uncharacterized protein LOC119779422 isoform X2 [Cyprinodon tularosa]|uniref:uncharacterized protein LOC119779422 isoform X2 n=1 Tax=Cyprinodon tularosa TaxID=77115 RepID=UPI0018E231E8|nr:uncharacterized protein LOC119779422 isoform X2 [Cyprinodon tularosa]